MKNAIIIGGAVLVLGGAGLLGQLGDGPRPPDAVSIEAARPVDVRVATLRGECPEDDSLRDRCPGGTQAHPSIRDACLCYVDARQAEPVADELRAASDLRPEERVRLTVCCDRGRAKVLRLPGDKPPKDCYHIGEPVSDFVAGDMATDFSRLMAAACAPCPGPGGLHCPACLCAEGGCRAVCREAGEITP